MANEIEKERLKILELIKKLQKEIADLEEAQTDSSSEQLDNDKKLQDAKKKLVSRARELRKVNEEIRVLMSAYLEHQKEQQNRIRNISDQQFFIKEIEQKRLENYNNIDTKLTGNLEKFNEMADLNIEMSSLSADQSAV
jgi:hypothetical protein